MTLHEWAQRPEYEKYKMKIQAAVICFGMFCLSMIVMTGIKAEAEKEVAKSKKEE